MNSYKDKSLSLFGLICLGTMFSLMFMSSHVIAGAPKIEEMCLDNDGIKITSRYNSNLNVFAEARMIPRSEREDAKQKGVSPFYILINPELYYLGQHTQQWLYVRQCVLIRHYPEVLQTRRFQLDIEDEQKIDCLAIQSMRSNSNISITVRLIESIERDLDRLLRDNNWNEVLSGPERRVNLMNCK